MKTASLFAVLMVTVCLIGCEDPELVTCQQEKDVLQGQLDQASAAIAEKDSQIEALKAEKTQIETKAMESITTMMTKQGERDKQLKQKLAERAEQVRDLKVTVANLEAEIDAHVCAVPEAVDDNDEKETQDHADLDREGRDHN